MRIGPFDVASKVEFDLLAARVLKLETAIPPPVVTPPPPPVVTAPGTVSDLAVTSVTATTLALRFTEVSDGAGLPAKYALRYAPSPLVWGSAPEIDLPGTSIGAIRHFAIGGLTPGTTYQCQVLAYRGTLNVDAVFGGFSNLASSTTTAVVPPPVVTPPPSTGLWPNEPAGFRVISEQPWNAVTGNGWNYLRRSASKDSIIIADSAAPVSPPNALEMIFTTDMQPNSEPGVHWTALSGPREIYTAWAMKVSNNWACSPAGCGKITFLWADVLGQVYTNLYHQAGDVSTSWITGPPYRVGINTEWAPYGQKIWLPNVVTVGVVRPGEWHRVEFYFKWETNPGVSGDGILRWWVDGVLHGDYTNVHYPNTAGFTQFEYAPTVQNPPSAEQYMYIDHTHVSVP